MDVMLSPVFGDEGIGVQLKEHYPKEGDRSTVLRRFYSASIKGGHGRIKEPSE